MTLSRRSVLAIVLASLAAAVFVRLGFWQLDRLRQRRARNAEVARGMAAPPASLDALPASAAAPFRRVQGVGTYDFDNELVQSGRTLKGSPGVYILTPLRLASGRVVLVNRGWVYSPDAATVDLRRWREPARAAVLGYVQRFEEGGGADARAGAMPHTWRRLDGAAIARDLPYPIEPFYLVALPQGAPRAGASRPADTTVRLTMPELSDGPHRSYALQWFSFAVIALAGAGALVRQDVRARRTQSQGSSPEGP